MVSETELEIWLMNQAVRSGVPTPPLTSGLVRSHNAERPPTRGGLPKPPLTRGKCCPLTPANAGTKRDDGLATETSARHPR